MTNTTIQKIAGMRTSTLLWRWGHERPVPDGRAMVGVQAQPRCRVGFAVLFGACSPLRTAPVTHTCTMCSFSHSTSAATLVGLTRHSPDVNSPSPGPGPSAASCCIWSLNGAGCCARVSSGASSTLSLAAALTSSSPQPPVQACQHSHLAGVVPIRPNHADPKINSEVQPT